MWLNFVFVLYAQGMLNPSVKGLRVIEWSQLDDSENPNHAYEMKRRYLASDKQLEPDNSKESPKDDIDDNLASEINPSIYARKSNYRAKDCDDPKEQMLKDKIYKLVEQTLDDADRKMASITEVKERGKELAPYKIGFILNMVKKSRDVQNELFNVAVKHRDDWKTLEQMKIFELMVHTNVDTTNLVRQMVEIHVQHSNHPQLPFQRKRVVMLRKSEDQKPFKVEFKDIEINRNPNKVPLTGRRKQEIPIKPSNETLIGTD